MFFYVELFFNKNKYSPAQYFEKETLLNNDPKKDNSKLILNV